MRKSLFLSVLGLFVIFSVFAQQVNMPPQVSGNSTAWWSQMWNTSSVYYGTTPPQLGLQLDSVGTTNLYLSVATWNSNLDSFVSWSTPGFGNLELNCNLLYATGASTVTCTPVQSSDAYNWTPVPGVVATTIAISSIYSVTPYPIVFNIGNNVARYYGVRSKGNANVVGIWGNWYFAKNLTYPQR